MNVVFVYRTLKPYILNIKKKLVLKIKTIYFFFFRQCESHIKMLIERHSSTPPDLLTGIPTHGPTDSPTTQHNRQTPQTKEPSVQRTTAPVSCPSSMGRIQPNQFVSVHGNSGTNQDRVGAITNNQLAQPMNTYAKGLSNDKNGFHTQNNTLQNNGADSGGNVHNNRNDAGFQKIGGTQNSPLRKAPPNYENVYDTNQKVHRNSGPDHYQPNNQLTKGTHQGGYPPTISNSTNVRPWVNTQNQPQPQSVDSKLRPGVTNDSKPISYIAPPPYPRTLTTQTQANYGGLNANSTTRVDQSGPIRQGSNQSTDRVEYNKMVSEKALGDVAGDYIEQVYTYGVPKKLYNPTVATNPYQGNTQNSAYENYRMNNGHETNIRSGTTPQALTTSQPAPHMVDQSKWNDDKTLRMGQKPSAFDPHIVTRNTGAVNSAKDRIQVLDYSRKTFQENTESSQKSIGGSSQYGRYENAAVTDKKDGTNEIVDPMKQLLREIQNTQAGRSYLLSTEF